MSHAPRGGAPRGGARRAGAGPGGAPRGGRSPAHPHGRRPAARGRRRAAAIPPPVELRTEYAFARVEADPRRASVRRLLLDDHEAGEVDLADPRRLEFAYLRRIADVAAAIRPPGAALDVVHVGGGAFALPRHLAAIRPATRSEVYELDPGVIRLAREQLGLRPSRRLRVRVGDAADLIAARPAGSADLVVGDAFAGQDVPSRLATPEFVAQVRRVLREGGVYALNVIDAPPLEAARAHAALLVGAFAHLLAIAPAGVVRGRAPGNVVLAACARPLPVERLRRAAAAAIPREQVLEGAEAQAVGARRAADRAPSRS